MEGNTLIISTSVSEVRNNATMEDVNWAIENLSVQDARYFADIFASRGFMYEKEYSLQAKVDHTVIYEFAELTKEKIWVKEKFTIIIEDWDIVKELYALFLEEKMESLLGAMKNIASKVDFLNFLRIAKIGPNYEDDEKEGSVLETRRISHCITSSVENISNEEIMTREREHLLIVRFSFNKNIEKEEINVIIESWEEVEELYALFLNSKFERVREILRNKIDSKNNSCILRKKKLEIILSLIKDDLIHTKLITGLSDLGLSTSEYSLDLCYSIFKLVGVKEHSLGGNSLINLYQKLMQEVSQINILVSRKPLDALALRIYKVLKEYQNEV